MWYNLDVNILATQLLPTFLRKTKMVAYIKSLVAPIDAIYYKWSVWRKKNLYKLAHTGQVCYLRKVLNDAFDVSQRRITIGNGSRFERDYIYTNAEQTPKFLGTMYLHENSDYSDTGVDFIVYVPEELLDTNNYRMKALIDFYKEGVKRYKIIAQ